MPVKNKASVHTITLIFWLKYKVVFGLNKQVLILLLAVYNKSYFNVIVQAIPAGSPGYSFCTSTISALCRLRVSDDFQTICHLLQIIKSNILKHCGSE